MRSTAAQRATGPFARLRSQHRQVLARLASLGRELRRSRHGVRDERPFRTLARSLAGSFRAHMAAEDGVLYPALTSALPELALTLEPLRADHAELHDMTRNLIELLALPRAEHRDEQLLVLGRDLADLLRLHIRREEHTVLDWAERVLPDSAQRELRQRLNRILRSEIDARRTRS